jgi:hypothetical protein
MRTVVRLLRATSGRDSKSKTERKGEGVGWREKVKLGARRSEKGEVR